MTIIIGFIEYARRDVGEDVFGVHTPHKLHQMKHWQEPLHCCYSLTGRSCWNCIACGWLTRVASYWWNTLTGRTPQSWVHCHWSQKQKGLHPSTIVCCTCEISNVCNNNIITAGMVANIIKRAVVCWTDIVHPQLIKLKLLRVRVVETNELRIVWEENQEHHLGHSWE